MSIFNSSDSIARTSDGAVNFRTTEICADGSQTTGQLKFRWQSSANQFWLPKNSYVSVELEIKDGADTVDGDLAVYTSKSPGDCLFSLVQHQINGTLVGSSAEPAVDGIILKRAFMKYETRATLGSTHGLYGVNQLKDTTSLKFLYTPPIGLWNTDSVGGGSHVLSLTTHTDILERIISSPAKALRPDVTVTIKSIKLMVAHATPETPVAPMRTSVINTIEMSTQSFIHTVTGAHSAQVSVPPSTRKIFISSRLLSLDGNGATKLGGLSDVSSLAVSFAGQESPVLSYGIGDDLRKYYDFNRENFMTGRSAFEELGEYVVEPITCHHFAKTTADVSTSATVRITADGSTNACNVYVSSLSHNAIVLTYNSSGYVEGVNYIVVN